MFQLPHGQTVMYLHGRWAAPKGDSAASSYILSIVCIRPFRSSNHVLSLATYQSRLFCL
jgi:hypothetical protein